MFFKTLNNCRPEVASDIISGAVVDHVDMDILSLQNGLLLPLGGKQVEGSIVALPTGRGSTAVTHLSLCCASVMNKF